MKTSAYGIVILFMVLIFVGCGNSSSGNGNEQDIDMSATTEDFIGGWEGTISVSNGGDSGVFESEITLTADADSLNGTWYDPDDQSEDNFSGTVSNGVFSFDLPNGSNSPDCAQWDMPMEATVNVTHTVMTMNGFGTVCGDGGGKPGTVTGSFNKTSD